ncbi:hypothetical protein X875_6780 [Mannheimia varigena USDA-ARS-USMARC-1388]|nr:hypothetical protein X875_6780 [Mannheimia varigena USDA-ARS-USMARC-1388]
MVFEGFFAKYRNANIEAKTLKRRGELQFAPTIQKCKKSYKLNRLPHLERKNDETAL